MNVSRRRLLIVALAVAALAPLAWPGAAAAQSSAPSLRLLATGGSPVTLHRFEGRVRLNLSVWVAATSGDFELRVARPDYDTPVGVAQVDSATGAVVRDLPEEVLDGWSGLSRFLQVVIRDSSGKWVVGRVFTFCPNGWDRQRADDSGAELPSYPTFCGAGSPFTRGAVWGLDSGWATRALGADFDAPSVRIRRDGVYTLTVRILPSYVQMLEIPAADTRVSFQVRVKTVRRDPGFFERPAVQRAAPARGAPVPDITDPDPSTVPDLIALPLWGMDTFTRRGRDYLSFAATPWNEGPAPLVVEGFRRPGEEAMDAYQYFRDAEGNVVGRAQVGAMRFHAHPMHNHWHFLQFASFSLHDAANLRVVRSRKQAFCLAPTDAIDITVERAHFTPWEDGLGTSCGPRDALWVREVLQTGWGDTYFQGVPGQSFDITALPNGWYQARIQVNPLGALHEADLSNNVESRLLYLGGRRGARSALVTPWHGIDA
jgi:hypothetical protein